MGMSTHIIGFIPPDEKYKKMLAIKEQCDGLGISYPSEVDDFFDGEVDPSGEGYEVDLDDIATEWNDAHRQGLQIDVSNIPESVKIIRFYNSW